MHLPNGSQIFVENTRSSTVVEATAVSNATKPVFTVASKGDLKKGDIVIVTASAWGKLIDRVLRISDAQEQAITMEGIDTSDTNVFPAGATASFVKIESWMEIPCVQDLAQDGGEQQFFTFQCLSDDQEQQIPTYKSAVSMTYTFAHEYDNAIYPVLRKADESGDVKAMRMYVPKAKEIRMWAGVLAFNEIPQTAVNEMETVSLSCSLKGRFTFLPSEQTA